MLRSVLSISGNSWQIGFIETDVCLYSTRSFISMLQPECGDADEQESGCRSRAGIRRRCLAGRCAHTNNQQRSTKASSKSSLLNVTLLFPFLAFYERLTLSGRKCAVTGRLCDFRSQSNTHTIQSHKEAWRVL